jgi:hypothetical protein
VSRVRFCFPISRKPGICQKILVKLPSTKFRAISFGFSQDSTNRETSFPQIAPSLLQLPLPNESKKSSRVTIYNLQFTTIHQPMHNLVFTPSHYITTLKIPTHSIPCGVIIRQFVHQVSLYKTSISHINLNIFKIMSPVVAILYLL